VYEGSLITVTAFFAIVPKVIIFSVFLKLTFNIFISFYKKTGFIVAFFSLSSISFASVTALFQKRLKRLLAYSAISHTGFILLAISCDSVESFKAFIVYIVVYIIMTMAAFTLIFISSNNAAIPKYLTNWTSFASQNVLVAFTFAVMLFSMAGIPPFAGFFSKLCVFLCLLSKNYIFSSICVAFFSSVACFYYIRLIKVFFFVEGSRNSYWTGYNNGFNEIYVGFSIFFVVALLNHLPTLLNVAFLVSFSII
jgi:NADH-quinone oxidoreductase subunit N